MNKATNISRQKPKVKVNLFSSYVFIHDITWKQAFSNTSFKSKFILQYVLAHYPGPLVVPGLHGAEGGLKGAAIVARQAGAA